MAQKTVAEKKAALDAEIRAQWAKYDAAVGTKPHVALVQIDRKLTRLEREREALEVDTAREL